MNDTLITFQNVSKIFQKNGYVVNALDNVSFHMKHGEILGIIGESGSGKSTVVKLLTGLFPVTEGQIFFDGTEITSLKPKERHRQYTQMQMVFQNAVGSFNPRRKIGQSIGETISRLCFQQEKCIDKAVENFLRQVGLKAEYADKYPHELSGGECQRAAIARAMTVQPRLLICDEATSALDVSAQAQIVELLLHLREEKDMSLLFITHDLPLVSSLTERIIIMQHGAIIERGNTADVISSPQTAYTKKLLDAIL